ncbi:MAG TPA: carboxypeptidase regulatory-like domain-containing protein [Gemmatimonadaceae bacterium]|nr:carboxypeptidase regulatory-like domain-containing protein [Gemmatimonadaceae bacterium]
MRLLVLVRDAETESPLSGVRVLLDRQSPGDTTDAEGIGRIPEVAPGRHVIELHLLGYAPDSIPVIVADTGNTPVEVELRPVAKRLPRVTANARRTDEWLSGFMRRRAAGAGFFFTRQQIDSSRTRTLAELLREGSPALLVPGPAGQMYLASHSATLHGLSASSPCFVQVYYDGTLIFNPLAAGAIVPDLRDFRSYGLEGVEYYPDPAATPVQFRTGAPSCGTLVLWSRIH